MCFYNDGDYDWTASHSEKEDRIADRPRKCCECDGVIAVGETYHWLFQQEQEPGCCKRCEDSNCDCVDWDSDDADPSHECKCEKPDYGETWTGNTCTSCRKFLAAVKVYELAEGCREYESQPLAGQMVEQMQNFDADNLRGYFAEAEKLHPELLDSGYLARLWEMMCGTEAFAAAV